MKYLVHRAVSISLVAASGLIFFHAHGETSPENASSKSVPEVASWDSGILKLPQNPSDPDIFMSRVFPEPLVPTDANAVEGENAALARVLEAYSGESSRASIAGFDEFLSAFPNSRWRAALQTNLGIIQRKSGYFSDALNRLENAWKLAKNASQPEQQALGNRALAELADLNARFGRMERMEQLLRDADRRSISGSAHSVLTGVREGYWKMVKQPARGFRCGPYAVNAILAEVAGAYKANPVIAAENSNKNGTSLKQVQALAAKVGLDYVAARRVGEAEWVVPSVVHWKVGHFAAITKRVGDLYLVKDPTFGKDLLITADALNRESTGFALVAKNAINEKSWKAISSAEAAKIWGKGGAASKDPDANLICNAKTGSSCKRQGMAAFAINLMQGTLTISDRPLLYQPEYGPYIAVDMTYNEEQSGQPQNFDYPNFGPLWVNQWVAFVEVETTITPAPPGSGGGSSYTNVSVYPPGGGAEYFSYSGIDPALGRYFRSTYTGAVLRKKGAGYERELPNGSREIYAKAQGNTGRFFMSEFRDPQGYRLQFNYDTNFRLTSVTDAANLNTQITYKSNTVGNSGYFKVHRITDPYGRYTEFTYDGSNRLQSIRDAVGMVSSFEYGNNGFVSKMTTPYGATQFYKYTPAESSDYGRGILAIHPDRSKEALESYHGSMMMTYYWDRKAFAMSKGNRSLAFQTRWLMSQTGHVMVDIPKWTKNPHESPVNFSYNDESSAEVDDDGNGEPDNTHFFAGAFARPNQVTRSTSDGTQTYRYSYNGLGRTTKSVDPLGRVINYKYAGNEVDLLEVRGPNNDLLAKITYDDQHRPLTQTDASGRTTTFSYGSQPKVQTVTNAKGEVTTYRYGNAAGAVGAGYYLVEIDGPLAGNQDRTTFTYLNGNLRTSTRYEGPTSADQYTLTYDFDALNRLTRVTYPDGTFEENVYSKLDVQWRRDRGGKWTYSLHDSLGQLALERDPAGRTTRYEWCYCGKLQKLTDAQSQVTQWAYNENGQMLSKTYADNTQDIYTYEPDTGRLATITDARYVVKTYDYNLDDSVASVSFAASGNVAPTSPISYTYDPNYPRISTATNGYGTYSAVYKPFTSNAQAAPENGRGRLQRVENSAFSPVSTGTVAYEYDELGRIKKREINGTINESTWNYDADGRLSQWTNPLGTFTPTYQNAGYGVGRFAGVTLPLGLETAYQWEDRAGDFRLKEIKHLNPSYPVISKFNYVTNAESEITKWTTQRETATPERYDLDYDAVSQLKSGQLRNVNTNAMLRQDYFRYDKAGNRLSVQRDNSVTSASYNNVNQLTSTSGGGTLRFKGTLVKQGTSEGEPGNVTLNGAAASMSGGGTKFEGDVSVTPGTNNVTVEARDVNNNVRTNVYQVNVPTGGAATYTYDLAGNMVSDGSRTFTWDALNRLVRIAYANGRKSEFTYDALGRRVKIIEKNAGDSVTETRHFIWDGLEIAEQRDAGNALVRRYYPDGFVTGTAATPQNWERFLYLKDHLGSIRAVFTGDENTVDVYQDYDLWGVLTVVPNVNDTPADFGYTGHYYHATSGLHLAPYRVYSSDLGRWLSRDPLNNAEMEEGPNLYVYVSNDSINAWDPFGLSDCNVFPLNEPIKNWADKTRLNDRYYTVGGHGFPRGMIDSNGNPLSPEKLADIIKSDPKYDACKPVKLDSCNTGKSTGDGSDNFAQQLANALKNTVYAPNNFVWYNSRGETWLADRDGKKGGKYIPYICK